MALTNRQKRGILQVLFDRNQSSTPCTLLQSLVGFSSAKFDLLDGRFVAHTSINGQSASWALPTGGEVKPGDLADFAQEARELYARSAVRLRASGVADPTDAQLLGEMQMLLPTVLLVISDYSGLSRV